ncbi:hypothetical protein [Glutamicibacter sp. MCAF14]|uniref:hypothetical protein n=1 Tax=Glutamicibacter sp. MCAF14 TaxID=3233043 RepID=UPI003F9123D1
MNQPPLNPDAIETGAKTLFMRERKYHTPTLECPEPPNWEDLTETSKEHYRGNARAVLAVAQPEVRGYIIVDKKTNAIDWDGELHTSIESAIESMTGPHQSMCRTAEEEDDAANDGRTAWWRFYSIHAVTDGPEVNDAQAWRTGPHLER